MPQDHHYPRYHVRPPNGHVNDPNGPLRTNGRWHLYFQYTHDTARTGPVFWGHASSADLVRWRYHRPALAPHPNGADRDGCWSGNTVLDGDDMVAFYSGRRDDHPYQSVLSARSSDGGESFGPPRQVVADPDQAERIAEFRDPFVWREHRAWSMLVGAGAVPGGPSARLYTSTDLVHWAYQGPFATARGMELGDMWECPQLVSFDEREALLVSAYEYDRGGQERVLALIGRRRDRGLVAERVGRVDEGPDFYAASIMRDAETPIMWGWVRESRATPWTLEADWSGMISLPRAISLTRDGRLAVTPANALTAMRREQIGRSVPAQFEAHAELHSHNDASSRISLRTAADEQLTIDVDWPAGRVTIDRDAASRDPRARRGSFSFDEPDIRTTGTLDLRWFVDGSVSELFTGSGRCATVRFYPTEPPPWILTFTGVTGNDEMRVWRLAAES